MPTFRLETELTPDEKITIGQQISEALTALDAVREEKKAALSKFKTRIDGFDSRLHELNAALTSGMGHEDVEVEERPAKAEDGRDIFHLHRIPGGEKVGERELTDNDRQLTLGTGGAPADVDEAQTAETPEEAEEVREIRLAAEEAERVAEVERLAGEQAKEMKTDPPKNLLRAPKPRKPKVRAEDHAGNEIDLRSASEQVTETVEKLLPGVECEAKGPGVWVATVEFTHRTPNVTGSQESEQITTSDESDTGARFSLKAKLTERVAAALGAGLIVEPLPF